MDLTLTDRGLLASGTDVDEVVRDGHERELIVLRESYFQQRLYREALAKTTPDKRALFERPLAAAAEVTPLHALQAAQRLTELIIGGRWFLMQDAREAGASWTEIGSALGMSKQGARDWFKRKIVDQETYAPDHHDVERARAVLVDETVEPTTESDPAAAGTEAWRSMFDAAAALGHEDLIAKVVDLAAGVRDGDGHLVDELVVHARVLDYRYENRRMGYPKGLVRTPRLSQMRPNGLALRTREDPQVMTMNMITSDDYGNVAGFVSTTAGFLRARFEARPLAGLNLATLPADLPLDDAAAVVLYGTLKGGVSTLVSAIRDGLGTDTTITRLLDRLVDHQPFPWEQGGWNRD